MEKVQGIVACCKLETVLCLRLYRPLAHTFCLGGSGNPQNPPGYQWRKVYSHE